MDEPFSQDVGRKIRDEDDARACLEAAEAAGESRRAWARANGVDGRSLHCWYLSLRTASGELKPRRPVKLVELVSSGPQLRAEVSGVTLRISGVEIEVERGFDEELLSRVL